MEIIKLLVAAGADPTRKTSTGETGAELSSQRSIQRQIIIIEDNYSKKDCHSYTKFQLFTDA